MREEITELVHAVFRTGFDLKDRHDRGEPLDIEQARRELLRLLDDPRLNESDGTNLGPRFALVCWVDEILIDETPWGQQWSEEYCLELKLYQTRLRAHKFWDPGVKRAEARPGSDALEVYYLCFLLGFRGDYDSRPADLRAWADRVQPQIARGYGDEPSQLDKSTPESNVPLFQGRDKFQTMLKVWGGVFLVIVFALGFLLVNQLFKP